MPPAIGRFAGTAAPLQDLDRAVEGYPRHDFRMGKVLPRPAHLPDALVRLIPNPGEVLEQDRPHRVPVFVGGQAVALSMVERVENLAVDVELDLIYRGVADADGAGPFIPGQPWYLPLGESTLAAQPIHDLQLIRAAGDRAKQPVAPSPRLVVVPGIHQREQREGGVAQPAIPVIPVAYAAKLLGQRGGRGGDDAAGRRISKPLQYDERALDDIGPGTRRGASLRPSAPKRF